MPGAWYFYPFGLPVLYSSMSSWGAAKISTPIAGKVEVSGAGDLAAVDQVGDKRVKSAVWREAPAFLVIRILTQLCPAPPSPAFPKNLPEECCRQSGWEAGST